MKRSALLLLSLAACETHTASDRAAAVQTGATAASRVSFDASRWRAPSDSEIPNDSLGASIRRGLAIVTHTSDSLPTYAPGHINCTNCHLNGGRNLDAAPLTGTYARFPKYLDRAGAVIDLADRVNYCFTRSLAGTRLPAESREMHDILAYLAWLSRGVPIGEGTSLPGAGGLAAVARMPADTARGRAVYAAKCASCHQANGEGNPAIPPGVPALWGPKSFSVGASMARQSKAASFIWHNMPWGAGRTLSTQEANDVAAYVTAQPRPDSPGKERDWPNGNAPSDVPYATSQHTAYLPPPLLPRANPAGALVGPPVSVKSRGSAGRSR